MVGQRVEPKSPGLLIDLPLRRVTMFVQRLQVLEDLLRALRPILQLVIIDGGRRIGNVNCH